MKTTKVLLVMLLLGFMIPKVVSQDYEKDVIPTSSGDLEITFIKHATLMMRYNDIVIHIDPVSMFGTDYSKMPKADLILLTHEHPDHLDAKAIEQIKTDNTTILMNGGCYKSLGFGEVMANGDSKTVLGISIDAVPAYNLTAPNHPKGVGNGYVLQLGDKKVYIAGDTEDIPEMSNLSDIDIAFLPMNKPYTMSPEQVANAARIIRPKILYPYHYSETNPDELVKLLQNEKDIEVRIRQMQ
jgi:L-ascorbate metabolism protein UlaG (beta-lactamase superfamily)